MRIKMFLMLVCLCNIALFSSRISAQSGTLTQTEIIKMNRDGVSEDVIVRKIQQDGLAFAVTVPVMEEMIKEGISQGVLEVLLGYDSTRMIRTSNPTLSGPRQPGITVTTNPPGLTVFIDGQNYGVSPSFTNKIKNGKHIIRVEHPLFFSRQEEIEFDGSNDLFLKWVLEPREPIVRVSVNLEQAAEKQPWSWIIRPRSHCPACDVDLQLQPWNPIAHGGEATFLLDEASKKIFHGSGVTCLELNLWHDEVRRDLPLRQLPPPNFRFYITDVRISGIGMIDLTINVRINEFDPLNPEVTLKGDTGYLIAIDKTKSVTPQNTNDRSPLETLDGLIP